MGNPFRYGQIVDGEGYCPRPQLEKRLRSHLADARNVVLYGERRVGKTSLIHRVAGRMRGRRLVYVDLLGIKSVEDLLARALQAVEPLVGSDRSLSGLLKAVSRLGISVSFNPVTGAPNFRPTYTPEPLRADNLRQLGELWRELDGRRPVVVVFDEFQDVLSLAESDAALAVLRGEIQKLGSIPFCFSGSVRNDMLSIFSSDRSPFFKSAVALEVRRDDFKGWEDFLVGKFESGGRRIGADTLADLVARVDGSPGDVQQLCAAVWDGTRRGQQVGGDQVAAGLEEVFRNERKGYEQVLATVTGQQLNVLRALARLGGESIQSKDFLREARVPHASSSKAAMLGLEKRRVVFRDGEVYRFSNPFLRLWLVEKGV